MKHLNMHATFLRWPLGMTSYPAWADLYGAMFHEWHGSAVPFDDWLFERLRPLLETFGFIECRAADSHWFSAGTRGKTVAECIEKAGGPLYADTMWRRRRVVLKDGTVIREWPTDEYDGIF